jgi:tRNA isopentenyl-2-thiomethyl-A-37 hydroxylase MiaE
VRDLRRHFKSVNEMGDARRVFFASESRRRDAIYQDLRARMLQLARHVHPRRLTQSLVIGYLCWKSDIIT